MENYGELIDLIKAKCNEYSLTITSDSVNDFRIFTDHASGITLYLNFEKPTGFTFHFLERTYDIVYHGDRTDAHVVISLMFASCLRSFKSGISCSLFDIPHPAIEDEIWGRYIMPQQTPGFIGISTWKQVQEAVLDLIGMLAAWREVFWSFASCPCEECCKRNQVDNYREYQISEEIAFSITETFNPPSRTNSGSRARPNWMFFYDIDHEVTIIKSTELSTYLEQIDYLGNRKPEFVQGMNGKLIIEGEIKNFISKSSYKVLNKLFRSLIKNYKQSDCQIFPMENMIVSVVNPYIIGLGRLSGINEFKYERERLRLRHNQESRLLFPISTFEWEDRVCPNQFEALVKTLLEREPTIKTVRKPAPMNQGDKGRDLLIEWYVINPTIASETQPPTSLIKVVGQCKASQKTVGKNKVLDIRDTLESHNSDGFFLAVSTQISAALTEKLEELRSKGIWTFWWNRDDIETLLSKNQDLIPQFPKVLRAKDKVKFVEKDL